MIGFRTLATDNASQKKRCVWLLQRSVLVAQHSLKQNIPNQPSSPNVHHTERLKLTAYHSSLENGSGLHCLTANSFRIGQNRKHSNGTQLTVRQLRVKLQFHCFTQRGAMKAAIESGSSRSSTGSTNLTIPRRNPGLVQLVNGMA